MMPRSGLLLSLFILSLPITVRMSGPDSAGSDTASRVLAGTMRSRETRLTLGAGRGSFGIVDRGCENEFIRSREFRRRDFAGDLEQHVAGPLSLGIRAGTIHEEVKVTEAVFGGPSPHPPPVVTRSTRENSYVNPYLRLDERSIGISVGGIAARKPFLNGEGPPVQNPISFGLRVGRLDRAAFRVSWMEGVPILSEGDQYSLGVEVWPSTTLDVFVGGGGGPNHGAIMLRGRWWVGPAAALNFNGQIGPVHGDVTTGGVSAGITLRTPPRAGAAPPGEDGADAVPATPAPTPPDSSRRSPWR